MDQVVTQSAVLSTTDYKLFKSITSNREVDEAHVRKLMRSIEQENLLHLRPIDVTAEFGIIDGQHRLEAAERLGVPIFYQVGDTLSQRHISVLNSVSKHWSSMDYLNHFTIEGAEHYKKVSKFVSQHPKLGLSAIMSLLSRDSRGNTAAFRAGEFQVTRWDDAQRVASFCEQLEAKFGFAFAFADSFVKALDTAVRTGEYDHATMLRKIELQPRALVRCPGTKAYLLMLEEIFNYKTAAANRVHFC